MERRYVVEPYDLDIWQARAVVEKSKKGEYLFQIILREHDELVNAGIGIGRINLLWFREPFFHEPSGGHGEAETVIYRADGKDTFLTQDGERRIGDNEWRPASELLPRHNRYLLHHPYGNFHKPEELVGVNEYIIKNTGLEGYPTGKTLTEKTAQWWKERYDREFMDERRVCLVYGRLR